MSGELRLVFENRIVGKWVPLGEDGNEFDRSTEGVASAWREAQAAANLGVPWAGARFRIVDPCEGDHADDCALGIDVTAWCDCGIEPTIVEERVVMPEWKPVYSQARVDGSGETFLELNASSAYPEQEGTCSQCGPGHRRADGRCERHGKEIAAFEVRTRVLGPGEAGALGLGPLVVEGVLEAEGVELPKTDGKALVELSRLSPEKVAEPWSGRPAQKQVLSNTLYGRGYSKEQKKEIMERMTGRPLGQLAQVVAEVLG